MVKFQKPTLTENLPFGSIWMFMNLPIFLYLFELYSLQIPECQVFVTQYPTLSLFPKKRI